VSWSHAHAQGLKELERLQGRGEVCLRLKFKRGLHPFFPPQVQLLRPRCLAPIAGALSSHPMLQLSKWDPWRPQRDLLEHLRTFLEVRAVRRRLMCPGAPCCILEGWFHKRRSSCKR
jgi:hypothetical protein